MTSVNDASRIRPAMLCPRIQIFVASEWAIAVRHGSMGARDYTGRVRTPPLLRYRHRNRIGAGRHECYRPPTHVGHPEKTCIRNRGGGANVKVCRSTLIAALLWCFAAGSASAQAVAGSQISGVVKDASGAVLPGVAVTVTDTDTGATRTVVSGSDGAYVFPNLPVGPYTLKAVLQGFNTYVKDGIVLQVNTNPTFDVMLTVGNVGEQVTVTADTTTVETRSTGVGQVIDHQQ